MSATIVAGLAALVVSSAASCIPDGGDRLSQACGVVVDGSGSGSSKGFNATALLNSAMKDFLKSNECKTVDFAPIDGNSEASACKNNATFDIDPDGSGNVDRRQLRASKRKEAVAQAHQVLKCIREDKRVVGGSDVLGGLRVISGSRPLDSGKSYAVLVVSDFVQTDPVGVTIDFEKGIGTPQSRAALVQRLDKEHLIADLKNTAVTAVGFGTLYDKKESKEYPAFRIFWEDLMKKTECRTFRHD